MRLAVIIPALNEAESLPQLLEAVPRAPGDTVEVTVVDNGSTDGTAAAAGVRAAGTAEVLVFLDGDGSFDPAEMPALLAPLRAGQADLALGSRLLGGQQPVMPPHQHLGNWLAVLLLRRLYGLALTDVGPYRAVRAGLLAGLDMREMTYGWPVEMIVKAARCRARLVEVPVSYRPRRAGSSKVSGTLRGSALAAYTILRTTFKYARCH